MNRFKNRLAAGLALLLTSAVSMLAGGVLLGTASADNDKTGEAAVTNSPASFTFARAVPFTGEPAGELAQVSVSLKGEGSCFIAFDPATISARPGELVPMEVPFGLEGAPRVEMAVSATNIVNIPEGQLTNVITNAVPGVRVFELPEGASFETAPFEIALSALAPAEECQTVGEDGTVTLPDGSVVTIRSFIGTPDKIVKPLKE